MGKESFILTYPNINPVAFGIVLSIHWYGIAYVIEYYPVILSIKRTKNNVQWQHKFSLLF